MLKFITKRVLKGLLCVWFIWTMIFFLVRLTGDPTDWMLPDGATEQEIANLRTSLHLDEPLTTQYVDSLMDMFTMTRLLFFNITVCLKSYMLFLINYITTGLETTLLWGNSIQKQNFPIIQI